MPEYSFICRKCGQEFTANVPWQRKREVTCPRCGGGELKEKYSLWGWARRGDSHAGSCDIRFG